MVLLLMRFHITTGLEALRMKPYMVKFCDWAFTVMQDGRPRTAKQLFEQLHMEDRRKTRYITNATTCNHALKADPRFEVAEDAGKGTVWKLA